MFGSTAEGLRSARRSNSGVPVDSYVIAMRLHGYVNVYFIIRRSAMDNGGQHHRRYSLQQRFRDFDNSKVSCFINAADQAALMELSTSSMPPYMLLNLKSDSAQHHLHPVAHPSRDQVIANVPKTVDSYPGDFVALVDKISYTMTANCIFVTRARECERRNIPKPRTGYVQLRRPDVERTTTRSTINTVNNMLSGRRQASDEVDEWPGNNEVLLETPVPEIHRRQTR